MQKVLRVKIVLLGDAAVGKTTLRKAWVGEKAPSVYLPTCGAEFSTKRIPLSVGGERILLEMIVWDIAGHEEFVKIRSLYISGAEGALIVYDVTRPETFYTLPKWISDFLQYAGRKPFVLVGNKIDLRDECEKCITPQQGQEYARILSSKLRVRIGFIETSALMGVNVDKAFELLARLIVLNLLARAV